MATAFEAPKKSVGEPAGEARPDKIMLDRRLWLPIRFEPMAFRA
jgi:hypothetical protein